ncbi:hypothetical protein COLO4_15002 [Corchorus olitorius]|uniref:At1g61320/AtMIF1 LRR domain-containing protein n=1 Tax=Corchorus olitorius TaxID=93759 RepID=A0A1R3JQ00_9ROSI|nr:hypothetical protein COLO4_15002 [Corchorus olitorius]
MEARDDDRISKLSDDILHVIVSLLSEKEGLRVRSLSRRWRVQKFPKLHSLEISFWLYNEYASDIDEWVSLAASMAVNKVEFKFAEIKLPPDETDIKTHKLYRFPWPTLISTRPNLDLEYLCLEACILKPVPPDLGLGLEFSSLKTLSLGYLVLDQDDFNKIASACFKLECLMLRRCTLPQTFCIGGRDGTVDHLKSLVLDIWGLNPKTRKLVKIHDLVNLKRL